MPLGTKEAALLELISVDPLGIGFVVDGVRAGVVEAAPAAGKFAGEVAAPIAGSF